MVHHELNKDHLLIRLKSRLLMLRSLLRIKRRVDVSTFAVARVTLLLQVVVGVLRPVPLRLRYSIPPLEDGNAEAFIACGDRWYGEVQIGRASCRERVYVLV